MSGMFVVGANLGEAVPSDLSVCNSRHADRWPLVNPPSGKQRASSMLSFNASRVASVAFLSAATGR
jgi:hypothetical protein